VSLHEPSTHDLFSDNHRWADMAEWKRAALALHRVGPVHRVERNGYDPFFAVISHDLIMEIERQPALFTNAPEVVLSSQRAIAARPFALRTLVHMDDPDHAKVRQLTMPWFKPASLRRLTDRFEELSTTAMRRLTEAQGSCDFAVDIALPYPLEVILEILGLPEQDYPLLLTLTRQMFGQEDPDLRREGRPSDAFAEVVGEIMAYFTRLTAERQANPTDDLASLIANGTIDGEPIPEMDKLSYYLIIATAGHDTTSSAIAGGMHALLEHPEQLRRLQRQPELLVNAVEEMIRWSTPARHFMRTATADVEVGGHRFHAGDWLYLSYTAANVDPTVFDDPLRFDIERSNADRQIAFGQGVHFCLGAQLARMEMRSLFGHLLPRFESIELDGDVAFSKTTAVGGVKRLPIRYTLTAS
jgi:cytochrome P450